MLDPKITGLLNQVSPKQLEGYVRALEGIRHGQANPEALEARARWLEETLMAMGLPVENQPVSFSGREYRNLIVTRTGSDPALPFVLVGAHYDGIWDSPAADDNASGVAVVLEAARILSKEQFRRTIQYAAFTLEEPQTFTHHFLIGSRAFVSRAKRFRQRYEGALILECVGYADQRPGSQYKPALVRIPIPDQGNFLGVISNRRSAKLMQTYLATASVAVPELPVIGYRVPFGGWLAPETRASDHASFWNRGYPALMLTDTAMFRNPHYHRPTDRSETLDYHFMAGVAQATIAAVAALTST
jgi:Zn-dependent M28 family amino/carboxypeptidase